MPDSDGTRKQPPNEAQPPASREVEGEEKNHGPGDTRQPEIGGADGPEPTRYGDWERNGRCTDF